MIRLMIPEFLASLKLLVSRLKPKKLNNPCRRINLILFLPMVMA